MLTQSVQQLEKFVYDAFGTIVRIHWNETIIQLPNQFRTGFIDLYQYNEATIEIGDTRSVIIERIIGSCYTTGGELAVINNQASDPSAYAEYQAFRVVAKALADEYLAGI